jgi:hypothetical protein
MFCLSPNEFWDRFTTVNFQHDVILTYSDHYDYVYIKEALITRHSRLVIVYILVNRDIYYNVQELKCLWKNFLNSKSFHMLQEYLQYNNTQYILFHSIYSLDYWRGDQECWAHDLLLFTCIWYSETAGGSIEIWNKTFFTIQTHCIYDTGENTV